MNEHKMTEGEEYIKYFLEDLNIKFVPQKQIKLKGDSKPYRIADFYLPNYKTYIEFQGKYRSEKIRQQYKEKEELYKANGISVIYLYPDNLGTIDFMFHFRLIKTLKENNLDRQLLVYKLKEYWEDLKASITALIIIFTLLVVVNSEKGEVVFSLNLVLGSLFIIISIGIIWEFYKFIVKSD